MLAAKGLVPLPIQELVSLQIKLLDFDDEVVQAEAGKALRECDPSILHVLIAETSDVDLVSRVVAEIDHPLIIEAALRRSGVPVSLLRSLAGRLSEDLQEILLLRQDKIVEDPGILAALEQNEKLSTFSTRRIAEYREHLLHTPERVKRRETAPAEVEIEVSDEEVEKAVELAKEEPAHGETDAVTGLSETQIRSLPVPVRLKLSRSAPLGMTRLLVRDTNPLVALSALTNSPMPESEIERIAASRIVSDEVLKEIGRNRNWNRKYSIVKALVHNPRAPIGLSVRLVPRLSVKDLRSLSRDRDVPEAVRSRAAGLYRMKRS